MNKPKLNISDFDLQQWVKIESNPVVIPQIDKLEDRLKAALVTDSVQIEMCEINTSGDFYITEESASKLNSFAGTEYHDLPHYVDVRILVHGKTCTERHIIWLPLEWNGRYLQLGGGSNMTNMGFGFETPITRNMSLPLGLRSGFACAITSGGIEPAVTVEWGLDKETGKLQSEMIDNLAHASTHRLAEITKKVIEIAYQQKPEYCYLLGSSGGGRQTLVEAMRYPEDFDAMWADCPGINWNEFVLASLWPAVVMNYHKDVLSADKLDAICDYAIEYYGGIDKYHEMIDLPPIDLSGAVGLKVGDEVVTELDVLVMKEIFDGPKAKDGTRLWYGIRPGVRSWRMPAADMMYSENGVPMPFPLVLVYAGWWIKESFDWKWQDMKPEDFEELFTIGREKFKNMDAVGYDITHLCDLGHKLMITHGLNDAIISPHGMLDVYNSMIETVGSKEKLKENVRLYLFPGVGHGLLQEKMPSFSIAGGMAALMKWAEYGIEPEHVDGVCVNTETFEVVRREAMCSY